MKRIGDRLQAKFGKDVDIKYVYNILSLGYKGEDILWLVENGLLTLGYQSSSYLTDRAPDPVGTAQSCEQLTVELFGRVPALGTGGVPL